MSISSEKVAGRLRRLGEAGGRPDEKEREMFTYLSSDGEEQPFTAVKTRPLTMTA
jgi:hypothetical protein